MVRGSASYYCFVTILLNETTGAKAKPGGDVMLLHCKKVKLFITGEVFLLDISLLMGDIRLLMGAGCCNFGNQTRPQYIDNSLKQ